VRRLRRSPQLIGMKRNEKGMVNMRYIGHR
jgi:hypothetical protein